MWSTNLIPYFPISAEWNCRSCDSTLHKGVSWSPPVRAVLDMSHRTEILKYLLETLELTVVWECRKRAGISQKSGRKLKRCMKAK